MRRTLIATWSCGLLVLAACGSGSAAEPESSAVSATPDDAATTTFVPSTSVANDTTTTTTPNAPVQCASDDDLDAIQTLLRSGQPTYDYEPPRDLAQAVEWADVVVAGRISLVERMDGFTTFSVTDVERLAGSGDVELIGSMAAWASGEGPDPLGAPVSFENLFFIAFLEEFSSAPGGWAPYIEGFALACSSTSTTTASLAGLIRGSSGLSLDEIAGEVRAVESGEPGAGTLGITRPVFDAAVCPALSAVERSWSGDRTFFAQPSDTPVAVQVIAEPASTPADPFALLLRYPSGDWRRVGSDPVDIAGNLVGIRTYPNGNGEASWELPDGGTGYLRSRGLTDADIAEIIAALVPEPPEAAPSDLVPARFRIDNRAGSQRFGSLYEGVDTEVSGTTATSECESQAVDGSYRLTAVTGDSLFLFGAVIDGHVPLAVGEREGTLVMIHGGPDVDGAPTIADVVDAPADRWATLLGQPDQLTRDSAERTVPFTAGVDVVVDVFDVAGSTPTPSGTYTLRLVVTAGVSFLEVSSSSVAFHPDATFETIEINGQPRSMTTVTQQSTHGVRISAGPTPDSFTVSVLVTDALGEPLQRSELIRLVPE